MTIDTTASIRQRSARMRLYVTVLWVVSVGFVVMERFSAAVISVITTSFSDQAVRWLLCQVAAAVPEVLFVSALWWVREALSAFSRGELFALPMTRMLSRVGVVLACGSAVRIFVVPGVCRLLGFDPGYWIAFDAAGMVLGAVGMALHAIASVLQYASAMQAELDEIF